MHSEVSYCAVYSLKSDSRHTRTQYLANMLSLVAASASFGPQKCHFRALVLDLPKRKRFALPFGLFFVATIIEANVFFSLNTALTEPVQNPKSKLQTHISAPLRSLPNDKTKAPQRLMSQARSASIQWQTH